MHTQFYFRYLKRSPERRHGTRHGAPDKGAMLSRWVPSMLTWPDSRRLFSGRRAVWHDAPKPGAMKKGQIVKYFDFWFIL